MYLLWIKSFLTIYEKCMKDVLLKRDTEIKKTTNEPEFFLNLCFFPPIDSIVYSWSDLLSYLDSRQNEQSLSMACIRLP